MKYTGEQKQCPRCPVDRGGAPWLCNCPEEFTVYVCDYCDKQVPDQNSACCGEVQNTKKTVDKDGNEIVFD